MGSEAGRAQLRPVANGKFLDPVLVFLSSAPPNRPRYADDIVRVLALPIGGQMQFRYARNWIAASVVGRIPGEQLADERILICFLAGDGKSRKFEIVPIRFARLIRAELVGTSCVFVFEAGPFVSELDDADVRAAVDSATRSKLPGLSSASAALFAFECGLQAPYFERTPNLQAFESAVSRVSAHPPFSAPDTIFFTLFRLSLLRRFSWFGTWPKPRLPSRLNMGSYILPSGRRYECEVYCLRPNDPPAGAAPSKSELSAEAEDDELTFVSATQRDLDSKYDVKRFVCRSDYAVLDRLTGFRLFITAEDGTTHRDVALPVVLRRSFLLRELKFLLVVGVTWVSAMIAAKAAGKLDWASGALLFAVAFFAGVTAIFPSVKKP